LHSCPMKRIFLATLAVGFSSPAFAEWRLDNGVAIVSPVNNNSTMELLVVSCGDPYLVEVFSRGGPVRPEIGGENLVEADYFYKSGKVQARIDGRVFSLAAASSDAAVVLFAEGSAGQNYLAPVDSSLIEALRTGTTLTLAFDVTPETNAADGTPHETVADFPLAGSATVLDAALAPCVRPA
jgi:hypothetical protein